MRGGHGRGGKGSRGRHQSWGIYQDRRTGKPRVTKAEEKESCVDSEELSSGFGGLQFSTMARCDHLGTARPSITRGNFPHGQLSLSPSFPVAGLTS